MSVLSIGQIPYGGSYGRFFRGVGSVATRGDGLDCGFTCRVRNGYGLLDASSIDSV